MLLIVCPYIPFAFEEVVEAGKRGVAARPTLRRDACLAVLVNGPEIVVGLGFMRSATSRTQRKAPNVERGRNTIPQALPTPTITMSTTIPRLPH